MIFFNLFFSAPSRLAPSWYAPSWRTQSTCTQSGAPSRVHPVGCTQSGAPSRHCTQLVIGRLLCVAYFILYLDIATIIINEESNEQYLPKLFFGFFSISFPHIFLWRIIDKSLYGYTCIGQSFFGQMEDGFIQQIFITALTILFIIVC